MISPMNLGLRSDWVMNDHNSAWIDTDDLTRSDGQHYDMNGINVLGERMASSFLSLSSMPVPEPSGLALVGIAALMMFGLRRRWR